MDHLPTLVLEARDAIQAAQSVSALDELRVRYLGKKGEVTALLKGLGKLSACLLYTSPSPRDKRQSRMPSSA